MDKKNIQKENALQPNKLYCLLKFISSKNYVTPTDVGDDEDVETYCLDKFKERIYIVWLSNVRYSGD